jgi:hypothetical protein
MSAMSEREMQDLVWGIYSDSALSFEACTETIRAAYAAGARDMRERAAHLADTYGECTDDGQRYTAANQIAEGVRALPLVEDP